MVNEKQKTLINFKKAQSLLAKISKMVEADEYCVNIMQQNSAAIGLLKSAHQMLMENHLNACFKKAMEAPKKSPEAERARYGAGKLSIGQAKNEKRKQEMIQEILRVTKLFNK